MRRRLNRVSLAVLLAALAVVCGGMHVVHGIQVQRNASALLDQARRAEAVNDLSKVEGLLGRYMQIQPEDGPTLKWYARIIDQLDFTRRERDRIFLVHEEALRYFPGDPELEHRCAELALELGRYQEAESHLKTLLEKAGKQPAGQPAGVERAEIEEMLGQCSRGLTRHGDAENWFRQAIQHDPARLASYDHLARLRRTELRRNEAADGAIREMVAKNSQAGRAYIYRWRYFQEFVPPPDSGDIKKALMLSPDDPEALTIAALASEQQADAAAARRYWEKGLRLDPKNSAFVVGLSRLETRQRHPERAEIILRKAFQANPTLDLAFELAETLILDDKIDGEDAAGHYIGKLRNAGLGDTYVRYLEARIHFKRRKWNEAIRAMEMALAGLRFDTRLTMQLNLMLAECYTQVGSKDQRMEALRQVAESERAPDSIRIEFARALAMSGNLDKAIEMLTALVEHNPDVRLDVVRLVIRRTSREQRDQRSWRDAERALSEAEKALPTAVEPLILLRADLLIAQDRLADALSLLSSAHANDPQSLRYRLGLARLNRQKGERAAALQVLDQAEKDLGQSAELRLARLDYWGLERGAPAKAAVAKLAETRLQVSDVDRPALLDRLAVVELRLGETALARQYWRELARLQPSNIEVLSGLLDLAIQAADFTDAEGLVAKIRSNYPPKTRDCEVGDSLPAVIA